MHEQFKLELLALVEYLLDPNKRLFVGYLAGAILFAFLIYLKQGNFEMISTEVAPYDTERQVEELIAS